VHVNDVEEIKTTDVQELPPTVTVAPETKPLPVMVIDVPPAPLPEFGETLDTVGGVAYVNPFVNVTDPEDCVTTIFFCPAVPAGVVQLI
jgi:hypothetical protein